MPTSISSAHGIRQAKPEKLPAGLRVSQVPYLIIKHNKSPMSREGQEASMSAQAGASFHEMLRDCRLAAGLTQEALAERASISARNVRALEAGANKPQRETAQRLATA